MNNKKPVTPEKEDFTIHQKVGAVYDLKLNNEGNFADVIVKRKDGEDSKLVMGQFIILAVTNKEGQQFGRVFIGTVESENPDMENNFELKNALRSSQQFSKKVDDLYKGNNLFVSYRCRMLGVCYDNNESIKYYSNIRTYPAPTTLDLYIPSNKFMNRLFATAVSQSDNDAKDVIFELGKLQYGTDPQYTKRYSKAHDSEVSVQFNATNLLRKRTGIFGKSGYGKSNTVKTVIGMMSTKHPSCGQLILDTNGEYALDNAQNEGLMDIFYDAGMKDKVKLYTHRKINEKSIQKFGKDSVRQLKFDVFDKIKPALEVVINNLDGRTEPLYLNPWSAALDGVDEEEKFFNTEAIKTPALVWSIWYAALIRAGLSPYNKKHSKKNWLTLSKEYVREIIEETLKGDDPDADLKKYNLDDEATYETVVEKMCAQFKWYQHKSGGITTNDIIQMAEYAEWYCAKNKDSSKPSSLKSFMEILESNRRLVALKAYNIEAKEGEDNTVSLSLGESVFKDLKDNKIVILDLASVSIQVAKVLAQHVLTHLFSASTRMFGDYTQRDLFNKFDALIYIEESQNYLKPEEVRNGSIYERVAKEGRKFHLGLVYITQQPSAIDPSITSQTENIIAMHMSNSRDCLILNEIKDKFDKLTCKFLKDEAQKGLSYIYAEPHQPFVLPCQIHQFTKDLILKNKGK